jgi:NAD(P)-dependent dehydrogenase (short-subunit alcohol dehydrogenase family)
MNLMNQVCAVTGAAKGIGLATAKALLARGARVALLDLDSVTPNDANAISIRCDVTRAAEVQAALDQITAQLGPIAVWVNNAGLARHRWIPDYTEAEIDLMLDVNLKGTILGSQGSHAALSQAGAHRQRYRELPGDGRLLRPPRTRAPLTRRQRFLGQTRVIQRIPRPAQRLCRMSWAI